MLDAFPGHLCKEYHEGRYPYCTFLAPMAASSVEKVFEYHGRFFLEDASDAD